MLTRRQYAGLVAVVGVTGLLGGGLSSLLVSGRSAQAEDTPRVVTAREFRVVDAQGRTRIRLASFDETNAGLLVLDMQGRGRAGLGFGSTAQLGFFDDQGRATVTLRTVSAEESLLMMEDTVNGREVALTMFVEDCPRLRVRPRKNGGSIEYPTEQMLRSAPGITRAR